jgi:hypothetical protein
LEGYIWSRGARDGGAQANVAYGFVSSLNLELEVNVGIWRRSPVGCSLQATALSWRYPSIGREGARRHTEQSVVPNFPSAAPVCAFAFAKISVSLLRSRPLLVQSSTHGTCLLGLATTPPAVSPTYTTLLSTSDLECEPSTPPRKPTFRGVFVYDTLTYLSI